MAKRAIAPVTTAFKRTRHSFGSSTSDLIKTDPSEPFVKIETPSALLQKFRRNSTEILVKNEEIEAPFELTELLQQETFTDQASSARVPENQDPVKSEVRTEIKEENHLGSLKNREKAPNEFTPVSSEDALVGPKNWASIYNEVVKMRRLVMTPVDTMGCEKMPGTIEPSCVKITPQHRFMLLISLMLSSQTKDEVNYAAMQNLQQHYIKKGHPGICLEAILESTEAEIDTLILKVGFHRRKSVYIKKACELLRDNFGGDVPKSIEEVVTLPGVGPKMGFLLLQHGWGISTGIGVDVHLHRLANMWGWVKKSDKPEVTRLGLEEWLPRKYWAEVNPLLVGFGQSVCAPRANNCDVCTLNELCKSRNKKLANSEITEARLAKLGKQRGDLSKLAALRMKQEN